MAGLIQIEDRLQRYADLLHELQFRDKIKSAEYHYAVGFDFDGFVEDKLLLDLFEKMVLLSKEFEFTSFKLGVSWPLGINEVDKLHLKTSVQTPLINKITAQLQKKIDFSFPDLDFLIDFNKKLVLVKVRPIYFQGRYCKFSREIAQTEYFCNKCRGRGCWYCNDTGHFSEESVEQLLGETISPYFGAKLLILHGAGREDMDVLMLGKGRPFIAELLMPKKRSGPLAQIENQINEVQKGKISVNSLKQVSLADVSPLKDVQHDKVYAALIHSDKDADLSKLMVGQKMSVSQMTPTRVEKRRAVLERMKEVTIQRVGEINPQEFVLILRTSHGTYVKEFISGDGEKTKPSISSLVGAHCECMLLDVVEVCD